MHDPQMVRAKYENRIRQQQTQGSSKIDTLEILLEQALFEEEQNQV
jgi:hypothetical protein